MSKTNKYPVGGFTLIELLVAVLIIGILAAIALPQYKKAVAKTRFMQLKTVAHAIANAEERYFLVNNVYSPSFDSLDIDSPEFNETEIADTSETRHFSWGNCWVVSGDEWGARTACSNNKLGITYYIYFKHSSVAAGLIRCRAQNTDLNSIQNYICKSNSGKDNPVGIGSGHIEWSYE